MSAAELVINLLFAARPSRGAEVVIHNMFESVVRALEFYCGIGPSLSAIRPFTKEIHGAGGLHYALARSRVADNAAVVGAFDWDQIACAVYTANHGPGIARRVRIRAQLFPLPSAILLRRRDRSISARWMRMRSSRSTRTSGSCPQRASRTRCSTQGPKGPQIPARSPSCT